MPEVDHILSSESLSREDFVALLSIEDPDTLESLREAAEQEVLAHFGPVVHFRGLIEFSNQCRKDCYYCGIRRGLDSVVRYRLSQEEIVDAAAFCAQAGYGSIVLQAGERNDREFIDFLVAVVRDVKAKTSSDTLPQGLDITLCVGEQSTADLEALFAAGAHRYLLRVVTTDPGLFASIHPAGERLESRLACLHALRDIGFLVGTGVMIGLPGQTTEMLSRDVEYFRDFAFDMVGIGPYIPHIQSPLPGSKNWDATRTLTMSLKMIAVTRLACGDANIAATAALQCLLADGRERGLLFGANVVMPDATPTDRRSAYQLYTGKPCLMDGRGL